MKKSIFWMAVLLFVMPIEAKVIHLLPKPQQIETSSAGNFALQRAVQVSVSSDMNTSAIDRFLEETGCTKATTAEAVIAIEQVTDIADAYDYQLEGFPNEAYTLAVSSNRINITAITQTGVIRAMQTLAQLAEGYDGTPEIESVNITDWPAFKLRGLMHDVGRSFVTVDEIKHELDLLARFKVNTFHFHLTENQAWRFEVLSHPELTLASNMTRFAGSYYTQEECSAIEDYAAERGIIVIPEIDMPGHSDAFETATGYDMQSTQGMAILKEVLDEVVNVFDRAPYIHIGADEVAITNAQFLPTMTAKLHDLGKKVVCWNPISGVTINTSSGFDMTQMWSSSGTVITGMPNIDCRYNYVNHFDVYADLVGIYKSQIYYADRGSSDIAGTITAIWNDRKTPTQEDIIKQNNLYANTLASAERAWLGGGKAYIETGGTTLPNSGDEFNEFADWERRFLFHKANTLQNEPIPYVKQTNVRWRITDPFPNGGDINATFPPETESELRESYTYNGTTYNSSLATGAGIYLRHTWGTTIPTFYSAPQTNHTAYAWTWVYSETAQTVGAQIEFQNYGRSEKDLAPANGTWDYKGSKVWVNGTAIAPPTWQNAGKSITNEVDLLNENFTARPVTTISLNAGWNKVLIKLPYVDLDRNTVRLNKWMFTFVLTDLDGKNAADVIYSPSKSLDLASEQVVATISEIEAFINGVVGTEPGYYPESTATELRELIAQVEETLETTMTATEREAQVNELQTAFDEFKNTYQSTGVIMPKSSSGSNVYYYTMKTPLRENRYLTSRGTSSTLIGNASTSELSYWRFEERGDGTYNIINYSDGTYLNPASATTNSAMTPSSSVPSQGWKLELSSQIGLFIITSGTSVELNQTTSTHNYQIFNWGWENGVANKTDAGCLYGLAEVTSLSTPNPDTELTPAYTAVDLVFDGSGPIRVPDAIAQPILAADEVTVVVDYTTSAINAHMAFTGAADTTATSAFLSCLLNDGTSDGVGIRWGDGSECLTAKDDNVSLAGARRQVVFALTKTSLRPYLNGTLLRNDINESSTPWTMTFSEVNNVNALYIGGFKTSDNNNKYPFSGTIHSIRYYTKELTDAEIAALEYDNLTEGGTDTPTDVFPNYCTGSSHNDGNHYGIFSGSLCVNGVEAFTFTSTQTIDDFTSTCIADVYAGDKIQLYVSGGDPHSRWAQGVAYFDWNKDGTWNTSNEAYELFNNLDVVINNLMTEIDVPEDAAIGSLGLRLCSGESPVHNSEVNAPCMALPRGRLQTFKINVKEANTTSLEKVELTNEAKLFYANDQIHTDLEGEITVFDLTGKPVKRSAVAPVSVSNLAKGVYIVRVAGKSMKFVK